MSIDLNRRRLLAALAAGMAGAVRAGDDNMPGAVRPPRPLPAMWLTLDNGRTAELRSVLGGHTTALQFVFTGCNASCSLLGATFQQLQEALAARRAEGMRLLSLSIDLLGDTPATLRPWLQRFRAGPSWQAAVPRLDQAGLLDALRSLGAGERDRDLHTAGVLLTNRQAQLVYRTEEFPDARRLADLMHQLAA